MSKNDPCNCGAYCFPHRAGSGDCNSTGEHGPCCAECGSQKLVIDPPEPGNVMRYTIRCTVCCAEDAAQRDYDDPELIGPFELAVIQEAIL